MKIMDILTEYKGNMIYSMGIHREIEYKTEVYPCESDIFNQVFGDNISLLGVFLSALVYYKSIVSKSNDVLIGVYDNSGSYRPIIFHSDPTFTIKDFLVYVEEQIKLFSEINTDELLNLYREHQIEYEELDFSFSLNNTDYAPGHNRGIIHLSLFNDGTTNHIKYNYNHNCVSHNEINRLQSRINAIVHNFMNNGDGKLFDKDIISDEEKDLILNEFNNTKVDFEYRFVHTLISEIAAKMPNKIALVAGSKSATYKELDEKSNQLARCLRSKGCKRNEFVAIALDKGIEYFIAMLAIIKSGSAFMPIDTEFPIDRVRYMLDETNCKYIISNGNRKYGNEEEINIFDEANFAYDSSEIDNRNEVDDRIYIVYTSGTTGRPKGVVYKHRGIINSLYQMYELGCTGDERIAHISKVTFAFSYHKIFFALATGLTLVNVPNDVVQDIVLFNSFIREYKINMLFCTTQFYSMIDAKGCKYVATAGGVATQKLVQKGIDECSVAYINMFGSTETQYISRWIATQPTAPKQIPIGKPVNNVRVYIMLNDRLCGVETIGEICVAGEGLAEGYLNNDELNKQKFEFSKVMGERIYHTGDLGKYLEDGNLMHMGRMDDQVKIRGIRIEISEIENVMAKLDGVTANVITVKQSDKIDKQLCLYFTANRPISVKEAKDHLRKYLPEYMVPAWVMQMNEFPMTRHKKIDKSALPDIANKDNDEIIEPTNKLQRDILNIFKEELNIDKMGINSDFFDFGGHSLKVTNLINKIDNIKNVRLTVSDIFKARTAEKIAKLLEDKCTSAENVFVKAEEKQFYPMSPIQRRLYAVYQADPESLSYNEPVVLESVNDIDAEKLECAFNKMIARHEIFRTVFFYKHGEFVQQIATEYKIKVDTETNDKELGEIVKDFVKPFDLEKLPLLRAKVVKQQNRTLILTDMHHIITDRGTVSKMLDELINLYKGKELEPVVWQYKDYSEWINKKDISNQKEFWINEFNDEIPVLPLPYCNNRTKTQSDKGSLASYSISEDVKNKVHNFALEHQITDYMVMLSAFFILLQKRSGQDDIVVGTPISVRTHKDTENIMGMFANTLALRGKPESSKTIKNFVNEVKETALSAYQNREYSIDELIDELNSTNNSSVNSLFNVMFVMQDSEDKFSKIGGYGLKEVVVSKDTSTFDFVFNILNNSHNGYDLYIEYSTDLFDESFINSLWSGFEHLLEEIPKRYNDRIGDLEIISDEEKNLVLQFMNFMD